ncbi:MAG: Sec-independent protein translocase subunit TatA [Pseudonocardia sp.]|uniref:Sec-independent protein translocase subunit TatA n=1 Tax=unclassified Pseudonocardia TaxID=2619320 RepID=UPI00086A1694|nr:MULTISPECIES: Sec-independent protein translocase subunit TatA [unclassified Pseudonocardia]MBN9113673.1 Sec-independent protein translocase subunit TatA [Pseudonocardia sp.]ODU28830.1 MAG: hypothetical protein ABS80_02270 [Pseudonocardia sp. SCN 72-51]ODU98949.1 MAG: hypothetical protein ABT15_32840 [Pseudonocardia sp. SCN 73-27]
MGALSPTHWLIVIGVVVLLFGAKRLPDAARSLGRSARILKAEVKDMESTPATKGATETDPDAPVVASALPPAAAVTAPAAGPIAAAERPLAG